jgi:hypothetical protein
VCGSGEGVIGCLDRLWKSVSDGIALFILRMVRSFCCIVASISIATRRAGSVDRYGYFRTVWRN